MISLHPVTRSAAAVRRDPSNFNTVMADILRLRAPLDAILLQPHLDPGLRIVRRVKSSYRNLVTKYDRNAEKNIVETLSALYPDVGVVAEESMPGRRPRERGWTWCIDPLDGTVNYAYGQPFFAVSIALMRGWTPEVGMVHVPLLRETFSAIRGRGAFLNGRRIRVRRSTRLRDALMSTGFPYVRNRAFRENLRNMNFLLPRVRDFRRGGAAAIDLAFVACGRLDGYFESGLSPWDVAAGSLLVSEAGGAVTDWDGGSEWILRKKILASNRRLQPALLRAIRSCR